MTGIELRTKSDTQKQVLLYLREELGERSAYVSYGKIAKAIGKSRHAVAYAIEKLRLEGEIEIRDGELSVCQAV